MLPCIFILNTLFSSFIKVFSSFLVPLCIFILDTFFSCFIKVFPSFLVLLCIFSLDILFSCFIKVFPSLLVLICILSLDILSSCSISPFGLCWCCFVFSTWIFFFVVSSPLAHLSWYKIVFPFLSFLAVHLLFLVTGELVSLHAISFCLSS